MPSKTLKTTKTSLFQKKVISNCSEKLLSQIADEFSKNLIQGDWILLEGELGAGKTTFAHLVFDALKPKSSWQGSPSFPIVYEYEMEAQKELIHIDLYRLKNKIEIEEAGIPSYFWDRNAIIIIEWLSQWSEFEKTILKNHLNHRIFKVQFNIEDEMHRTLTFNQLF